MCRLKIWGIIFIGSVLLSTWGCNKQEADKEKPQKCNILLFVSDDHGLNTGAYGNSVIKTPNFDSFTKEGIRFTNAYATTASCSTSRSVLLTGLHNHANAQYGHTHDYHHFSSYDDIKSLPVLLNKSGYRTASVGKYHVAPERVYHFETFIESDHRNPVEMAENCKQFIEADNSKPFFLYFATADSHRGGGLMAGGVDNKSATTKFGTNRFGNKDEGYKGIKEIKYKHYIHAPEILTLFPKLPKTHNSLHGKSFFPFLKGENPSGWDTIYASHAFHEIQMYSPMRAIRDRKYKLILNIAHEFPYPFSTDLWASSTWQSMYQKGMKAKYGPRTVENYIHRPKYEFYDIENDPLKSNNLVNNPKYNKLFEEFKHKLKDFQIRTSDPWVSKYAYE